MTNMTLLVETLTILTILRTALAAGVIKTFDNHSPTVYYDNLRCENGNPCGATFGPTWSDGIALGFAKCESTDPAIQKPYSFYKSNQFVAIDLNLFATEEDYKKYCGKKVRVTKPDGTEYKSAGGDLFVWDSCEACMTMPRVDFSAPDLLAMTGLTADQCGVGDPAFKIEILDESVVEYAGHPPDAPGGVDTFKGTDVGGAAVCAAGGENTAVATLAAGGTSEGAVASAGAATGGAGTTAEAALASSASSSTPLAGSVAASAVESSVDTATVLPVSTAVAGIASDGSGATSEATSAASTARGGYTGGGRGSWTRD